MILEDQDPKSTALADMMSTNLLTCQATDDVNNILQQMEQRQVKRILVIDQTQRCIGIISEADIARRIGDQGKVGELARGVYS